MQVKLLQRAVLQEGISHIEDLPLRQFIRTVETMKEKIVTEKLDGANLWFGLDERGFFTSREGKSSKRGRFYRVDDYPVISAYNGFRAAHLALEKVEPTIRKFLKEGDTAEIEVLYGRQPNTVTYGNNDKNFIVIIRGVNNTPNERILNLANALNNKAVRVESSVVSSPDGNLVDISDVKMVWEFTKVAPIEPSKIDTKEVMSILNKLKEFSEQPNKLFPELTNGDLAEVNLTSIPKDRRELAKSERERINDEIMTKFKQPIKELLLNNFVRKIKPMLQAGELDPSEDVGVEGVVVLDPVTGSQTKVVDKDVFTAINTFNSAVRQAITGLVRTADQDAPIESRGGAFGQAMIKIADLFGAPELAISSTARRFMTKFKKTDAQSTAVALAQSLNVKSLPALRTKIASILKGAVNEIDGILNQFKKEAGTFKLKLKTGKEIGISPEVMKRNLTAFAETKKEIHDITTKVLASRTPADLVLALYGRKLDSLFKGDSDVNEGYNFIKSISEEDGGGDGGATGSAAVAATTSSAIAPPEKRLFKDSKVMIKRKRNYTKPPKFPIPESSQTKFDGSKEEWVKHMKKLGATQFTDKDAYTLAWTSKTENDKWGTKDIGYWDNANSQGYSYVKEAFTLLRSVNEDWAHVSDMKFATDVDDKVQSENDVEFNQLRNNVSIGDSVTQMDVDRYLDKAHELNDEVDTVVYGLETNDGKVVKVYVNAAQADQFERACADMLGQEQDIQYVIDTLAQNFDVVDVEWPADINASSTTDVPSDVQVDQPGDSMDVDSEGEPEIDFTVYPDESGEADVGSESSDESADEVPSEEGDESTETPDEGEESSDEDEDDGVERDDFGQIIGKKKKKKDEDEESEEEVEEVTTEESVEVPLIKALNEDEGESITVPNPSLQMISNMLAAMGFDLSASRSFATQAKMLQGRNTPGLIAAKNTAVVAKVRQAWEALEKAVKLAPGQQQPQQNQGFELIGSVLSEAEGEWSIADLKDLGVQLTTLGMNIKIDQDEAEKLQMALEDGRNVSVLARNNKRYKFESTEDGYMVSVEDKPTVLKPMPVSEVTKVLKALAEE